jgi:hypothetical protein
MRRIIIVMHTGSLDDAVLVGLGVVGETTTIAKTLDHL